MDEWIAVYEKLPKANQYVLACVWDDRLGIGMNYLEIARYLDGKWHDSKDEEEIGLEHEHVTHWMKLPEFPEK